MAALQGEALGMARALRPPGPRATQTRPHSSLERSAVLCGRAVTMGHGNLLHLLWQSSRLTFPKPAEGSKQGTTPGQSLTGTDAKVLNQLVANGNGTSRDWG